MVGIDDGLTMFSIQDIKKPNGETAEFLYGGILNKIGIGINAEIPGACVSKVDFPEMLSETALQRAAIVRGVSYVLQKHGIRTEFRLGDVMFPKPKRFHHIMAQFRVLKREIFFGQNFRKLPIWW